MGLSSDPRLKQAAQQAIETFGLTFSSSRMPFPHAGQVAELEAALGAMYGELPVVVAMASIAGAHRAALTAFVMRGDAVVVDPRVNGDLRRAALALRATRGVAVETVRYGAGQSPAAALEAKIAEASVRCGAHGRIWFVGEGVDAVNGSRLDDARLNEWMERYPSLHAYIDDSHGAGWFGFNGTGTVFDEVQSAKDRLYLAFSLEHAMSGGGAAIAVPDAMAAEVLRRSAGDQLMLQTPVSPALLAAACEAARLMTAEEAEDLRLILMGKIQRFIELCDERGVQMEDRSESPVFYLRDCGTGAGGGTVTLSAETTDADVESLVGALGLFGGGNHLELA